MWGCRNLGTFFHCCLGNLLKNFGKAFSEGFSAAGEMESLNSMKAPAAEMQHSGDRNDYYIEIVVGVALELLLGSSMDNIVVEAVCGLSV